MMEYTDDELAQADFYGVSPDVIRAKLRPTEHRILVKEDGKLCSKVVSDAEYKELNRPKFSNRTGKYDSEQQRYGSSFNVRNTVFGNV